MKEEQVYQEYITTTENPLSNISSKKTHIQNRAIMVGSFVNISGYHVNLASLKRRFAQGGYHIHETAHFLLFLRDEAPGTIIVHRVMSCQVSQDKSRCLI